MGVLFLHDRNASLHGIESHFRITTRNTRPYFSQKVLVNVSSQSVYLITCLCTLVQLVVSGLSTFPAVVCMIVRSSIVVVMGALFFVFVFTQLIHFTFFCERIVPQLLARDYALQKSPVSLLLLLSSACLTAETEHGYSQNIKDKQLSSEEEEGQKTTGFLGPINHADHIRAEIDEKKKTKKCTADSQDKWLKLKADIGRPTPPRFDYANRMVNLRPLTFVQFNGRGSPFTDTPRTQTLSSTIIRILEQELSRQVALLVVFLELWS